MFLGVSDGNNWAGQGDVSTGQIRRDSPRLGRTTGDGQNECRNGIQQELVEFHNNPDLFRGSLSIRLNVNFHFVAPADIESTLHSSKGHYNAMEEIINGMMNA